MENEYLKDIYNDFFGNTSTISKESNNEIINIDFETEINKLYLNDESKELFRKIVNYIFNFTSDKRYIPFNITILSKTEKTIDTIVNILKNASNITLSYKEEEPNKNGAPKVNKIEVEKKEVTPAENFEPKVPEALSPADPASSSMIFVSSPFMPSAEGII